ncbi:MAG: N-glycosylase/DNA lyase [Caldisericia bacterium]|nr:N-glycosylase/DNA lyase [Caldisericia bacterium]
MTYNINKLKEINKIYNEIKDKIDERLNEFKNILKNGNDEDLIFEFIFCLLTPQSKAKMCDKAVQNLKKNFNKESLEKALYGVRFKNKKSLYIKEFLEKIKKYKSFKELILSFENDEQRRVFLVKNFKGIGLKEASHFLRNIGLGDNFAILDRHILKNLKEIGIIDNIPKNLSFKKYKEIEDKMRLFSKDINIDMKSLDFILWYKETREVFK